MRHEAAEALGAIAAPDCLELLQAHATDSCQELAETCQLALGRLAYLDAKQRDQQTEAGARVESTTSGTVSDTAATAEEASPYYSVDPTPALPAATPVEQLRALLLDAEAPMFEVRSPPPFAPVCSLNVILLLSFMHIMLYNYCTIICHAH